jgi:nitrogen fixation protein FixH
MAETARPPFEIRGVHVLVAMIAFFGLIIATNVAFSIIAIRSFPGEDAPRAYVQGLRYNETLESRAAQAALRWRASADLVERAGRAGLEVRLLDAAGAPIAGATVTGELRRPATDRDDRTLAFVSMGDGLYRAELVDLAQGVWRFRGEAQNGAQRFEFERRLTWRSSKTS